MLLRVDLFLESDFASLSSDTDFSHAGSQAVFVLALPYILFSTGYAQPDQYMCQQPEELVLVT